VPTIKWCWGRDAGSRFAQGRLGPGRIQPLPIAGQIGQQSGAGTGSCERCCDPARPFGKPLGRTGRELDIIARRPHPKMRGDAAAVLKAAWCGTLPAPRAHRPWISMIKRVAAPWLMACAW